MESGDSRRTPKSAPENESGGAPWGMVAGLAGACGATLLGILRDLGPDVILLRATVVGVVCGLAVSITRLVLKSL